MINVKEFRKKYCKPKLKSRLETLTEMYGDLSSTQTIRFMVDTSVRTGTSFVLPDNIVLLSPEDAHGLDQGN